MKIELANRIRELPPYLFARIDALKNEERKKGKDLIDLGIGDPDLPTTRENPHCGGGKHKISQFTAPLSSSPELFSTVVVVEALRKCR